MCACGAQATLATADRAERDVGAALGGVGRRGEGAVRGEPFTGGLDLFLVRERAMKIGRSTDVPAPAASDTRGRVKPRRRKAGMKGGTHERTTGRARRAWPTISTATVRVQKGDLTCLEPA
jgi:hypothetical protein